MIPDVPFPHSIKDPKHTGQKIMKIWAYREGIDKQHNYYTTFPPLNNYQISTCLYLHDGIFLNTVVEKKF